MRKIIFKDGTSLLIPDGIISEMASYRQLHNRDEESGGILLGKKKTGVEAYELSQISCPQGEDKRNKYEFLRSKNSHQHIITKAWKSSGGIVNYIGEWHTHAENIPYPSKIDLKLIEQIKRDGSCYYSKIFMIIVGRNSLCVFAYTNLTPRKDYLIGGIYENLYCDK